MPQLESRILTLKEQLNLELAKPDSDNSKILALSHELADLDTNAIRFSVDAGMINRLGRELVGRHETAVAELVKNAYDADATVVNLHFINTDRPGGTIIIEDNGSGMNREQLTRGFMTISSTSKLHNPKSERYQRMRAGQKGIGRFATQRIGEVLTIITETRDSEEALSLVVNWDDYEVDHNLVLIANKVEQVKKTVTEGTKLIITQVRDAWSLTMIKKAFGYISELLQPFPLSERFEVSTNDPGFKVNFFKDNQIIIDEESAFFQHSLAEIEGYVDYDGQGYYSFKSERLELPEEVALIGPDEREDKYTQLQNVHLKAYYFIWNVGYIPKGVEKNLRENARINGGVRLYRNGFRVLPYGEPNNDWLRLDASVARNTIIAPHGNMNFFGFVEVIDKEGKNFQEQSSREGLLENAALDELRDFIYRVLTDVAIKISAVRNRKGVAAQKNYVRQSSGDIIKEVKKQVETIIGESSSQAITKAPTEEKFVVTLKAIEQKLTEAEEVNEYERAEAIIKERELLKEIQLLRILAGLGLTIGEFIHEIDHYQPAFKYDAIRLTELANDKEEGLKTGERLQENLNAFNVYTSFFRAAISNNVNRELRPIELREPVYSFVQTIMPDLKRSHIELSGPIFEGYNLYTCPMHISEWASILFNLYTNAKKAIHKANVEGRIEISCYKQGNNVSLLFSDNGIGIPDKDRTYVFDAFFTTSNPSGINADEIDELTGTGLGLKIVKDTVEGYNGQVAAIDPRPGFKTTIKIELPKSDI